MLGVPLRRRLSDRSHLFSTSEHRALPRPFFCGEAARVTHRRTLHDPAGYRILTVLIKRVLRSLSRRRNRGSTCEPAVRAAQEVRDHREPQFRIWLDGSSPPLHVGNVHWKSRTPSPLQSFICAIGLSPSLCPPGPRSESPFRHQVWSGRKKRNLAVHSDNKLCHCRCLYYRCSRYSRYAGWHRTPFRPGSGYLNSICLWTLPGVMQSTNEPPSEWHKLVVVLVKPPNFRPPLLVIAITCVASLARDR